MPNETMPMPWDPELNGWDIIALNHYYMQGKKRLYCVMTKDGRVIKAEGDHQFVFNKLKDLASSAWLDAKVQQGWLIACIEHGRQNLVAFLAKDLEEWIVSKGHADGLVEITPDQLESVINNDPARIAIVNLNLAITRFHKETAAKKAATPKPHKKRSKK